jgi:hypothetical protein
MDFDGAREIDIDAVKVVVTRKECSLHRLSSAVGQVYAGPPLRRAREEPEGPGNLMGPGVAGTRVGPPVTHRNRRASRHTNDKARDKQCPAAESVSR